MFEYSDELIANCRLAQKTLCDCSDIDAELDELHREIEVVAELSRKAIYENAHAAIDQDEWNDRNNGYIERHRKATERVAELENLKRERKNKKRSIGNFIRGLESQQNILDKFDDKLWMVVVDKVIIMSDGRLKSILKDNNEIQFLSK